MYGSDTRSTRQGPVELDRKEISTSPPYGTARTAGRLCGVRRENMEKAAAECHTGTATEGHGGQPVKRMSSRAKRGI